MLIEYINFKFSFLNFELQGWSEEIFKTLQKDKYVIRSCFMDAYSGVKQKITGKKEPSV